MENNKNTILEKVTNFITIIAGLCTISGISIFWIYKNTDFIFGFILTNITIIELICVFFLLLVYIFKILYDMLKNKIAPTKFEILIMLGLLILCVLLLYVVIDSKNTYAEDNIQKPNMKPGSREYVDYRKGLSDEQKVIDDYVVESVNRIIPLNEWDSLSNEELYYIRNGIYAYSGLHFESDYYDIFPWYRGNIEKENFKDDMLNSYQDYNISHIISIETKRKNIDLTERAGD